MAAPETLVDTQINSRLAHRHKSTEIVEVNDLTVDLTIQQPLREGKVRHMLSVGYDPALASYITVSRRADGTLIIIDGQHRKETAKQAGFPYMDAVVWEGLTYKEENWLFNRLNDKSNPAPVYRFRALVNDEDSTAAGINAVLVENGWHLSPSKGETGSFVAVAAAQRIYTGKGVFGSPVVEGPELFQRTIETVTAAWGRNTGGSVGAVIEGVAAFLVRYWRQADQTRLVTMLSKVTPEDFRAQAEALKRTLGKAPAYAFSYQVYREYNKNLRNKLPDFPLN